MDLNSGEDEWRRKGPQSPPHVQTNGLPPFPPLSLNHPGSPHSFSVRQRKGKKRERLRGMTRGKQKIEAQRRNAERNQKPKGSQFEARAVALKITCPICKVSSPSPSNLFIFKFSFFLNFLLPFYSISFYISLSIVFFFQTFFHSILSDLWLRFWCFCLFVAIFRFLFSLMRSGQFELFEIIILRCFWLWSDVTV